MPATGEYRASGALGEMRAEDRSGGPRTRMAMRSDGWRKGLFTATMNGARSAGRAEKADSRETALPGFGEALGKCAIGTLARPPPSEIPGTRFYGAAGGTQGFSTSISIESRARADGSPKTVRQCPLIG